MEESYATTGTLINQQASISRRSSSVHWLVSQISGHFGNIKSICTCYGFRLLFTQLLINKLLRCNSFATAANLIIFPVMIALAIFAYLQQIFFKVKAQILSWLESGCFHAALKANSVYDGAIKSWKLPHTHNTLFLFAAFVVSGGKGSTAPT